MKAVERFRWPLFITLTMKNVDDLSLGAIKDLRRSFGRLRHQKFWKKSVKGGVACIEVTNQGKGWHPHLHAVVDCRFLSVKEPEPRPHWSRAEKAKAFSNAAEEVQQKWAKMLRQPIASIKIKRANRYTILKEVVKYSVKGNDLAECQGEIAPLIRAIEGTRLLTTFGSVFALGDVPISNHALVLDENGNEAEAELRVGHNCCHDPQLLPSSICENRGVPREWTPENRHLIEGMRAKAQRAATIATKPITLP